MKYFSILIISATILFSIFTSAKAQGGHEYAPLQEKEFEYKNWSFKNLKDGQAIDLRSFAQNKKLVMVVYFAAWCPNWRNEAPVAERLYQKYKNQGFDVIGVSEYASLDETKKNIADFKISFPIVTESEKTTDREKTTHFGYRQKTGDTRKWGSPWSVFLATEKLNKKGDTLLKKAFVVNGELIEAEAETFIRQQLGLPAENKAAAQTAASKTEVCEPTTVLKKP